MRLIRAMLMLARCCGRFMRCQCRAGSTPIAVAKSGAEGGGSEHCLRNRLRGNNWGSSDGQKRAVGTPLISLGPALVANSLCPGQEKHTMCELEVQIANSGSVTFFAQGQLRAGFFRDMYGQ
jgi:hypothetical protein